MQAQQAAELCSVRYGCGWARPSLAALSSSPPATATADHIQYLQGQAAVVAGAGGRNVVVATIVIG
jgi:hypothetical protein